MLDGQSQRRSRHAGRWTSTPPILALLAVLVLVGAGCGSSSDTKANDAYANSVCGAIGSWEQQVKSIATNLSGGLAFSPNDNITFTLDVQEAVDGAEASTPLGIVS